MLKATTNIESEIIGPRIKSNRSNGTKSEYTPPLKKLYKKIITRNGKPDLILILIRLKTDPLKLWLHEKDVIINSIAR